MASTRKERLAEFIAIPRNSNLIEKRAFKILLRYAYKQDSPLFYDDIKYLVALLIESTGCKLTDIFIKPQIFHLSSKLDNQSPDYDTNTVSTCYSCPSINDPAFELFMSVLYPYIDTGEWVPFMWINGPTLTAPYPTIEVHCADVYCDNVIADMTDKYDTLIETLEDSDGQYSLTVYDIQGHSDTANTIITEAIRDMIDNKWKTVFESNDVETIFEACTEWTE